MNEIDRTNLTDQKKIRLNEITTIENYFNQEIHQRKICCKKSSQYVAAFDYIDKILIVFSATSGGVCNISSVSVVGAPIGKAGASFTLIFSLRTGIIDILLGITKNKKKNHDKILILAKSKLNSIETLVSQALIDMEISHKKIITTLKEKDKHEKMKENVRNVSEKHEHMRSNSVNSEDLRKKLCEIVARCGYEICMSFLIKALKIIWFLSLKKNNEVVNKLLNWWF